MAFLTEQVERRIRRKLTKYGYKLHVDHQRVFLYEIERASDHECVTFIKDLPDLQKWVDKLEAGTH